MEGLKNPINLTTAATVEDLKEMVNQMGMIKYSDGFVSAEEVNKRIDVVFSPTSIISWEDGAQYDVLRVFTRNHKLRETVERLLNEKKEKTPLNNAVMGTVLKTADDVLNLVR